MANIQSQIKRNRQNEKRRLHNKALSSEMKTHIKTALATASDGDRAAAESALRQAQKSIDRAARHNVIHANTAARRKSSLMLEVERRLTS